MKIYNFSPSDYTHEYASQGYAHIVNGVCSEFLQYTQQLVDNLLKQPEQTSLHEFEIRGKKRQFLFEFPQGSQSGLFDTVAKVAGLNRDHLTLCERHVKIYDDTANPNPPPHKDRVASQVTVGLPLSVGPSSYIELYPNDILTINPFNSAALWRNSLDPHELPEVALKHAEPVKLKVKPGDTVLFRGSSIYHERINGANTRVLYLKFNDMRLDPTGEDPTTLKQIAAALQLVDSMSDQQLLEAVVEVSPMVEKISRHYTRLHWKEVLQCYVAGESEFALSETDFQIVRSANARQTVRQIIESLGVPQPHITQLLPRVRRLVQRKALVFIRDLKSGVR